MSMVGKLRQVSEFELAKFKKNPPEMMRVLGPSHGQMLGGLDAQALMDARLKLQQSPLMQRMMDLAKQGKAPSREDQLDLQRQMSNLMQELQTGKAAAVSRAETEPRYTAATEELDLHKSWHCLHYLFTGKVEGTDGSPLGDAIIGGTEIGDEQADMGYGPPRALSPAHVRSVAAALADFPIEQKTRDYDAAADDRAGIYVAQHGPEELKAYFSQLRDFYADAASKGNAMLLWIE